MDPEPPPFRVGFGYDLHRLVEGRPLILGGLRLEHSQGLDGHSDADVLLHALADALLGAVAAPDIGQLFPNTDPACKDMDSSRILQAAQEHVEAAGYAIANLDATVLAEAPKLAPHRTALQENIARLLGLPHGRVSLKATTNEGQDAVGQRAAIAVHAVALVYRQA